MIKGCEKRMIFVRETGNDFFSEAYFVLRDGYDASSVSDEDMVKAATRIACEKTRKRSPIRHFFAKIATPTLWISLGMALGSVSVCAVFLLFSA